MAALSERRKSDHPPALARDLGYLSRYGYQLDSVEMFDRFPQTFHIESLARLHYSPARPQ